MQDMLIFILLTIGFIFAGNIILKIFFEMIRTDGALDIVFGWQKMLEKLYGSTNKYKNLLGKALGDCERCVSFWFMPFWFICYYATCKLSFGLWITNPLHNWFAVPFVNWIWYSLFHSLGAQGGLIVLTKIFKSKSHVV